MTDIQQSAPHTASPHRRRSRSLAGRIGAAAAVVVAGAVLAGCGGPAAASGPSGSASSGSPSVQATAPGTAVTPVTPPQPSGRTITVSATGTADATPDVVTLQIGVETSAATASAALADNNGKAAALIATLKSKGVAEKDLQTSGLSMNPAYDRDGKITGYSVQNMLSVVLRDTSTSGAVIDAAATSGGNAARIQGISYSVSDDSKQRAAARAAAVQNAQTQAQQIAAAAGVQLGAVVTVSEGSTVSPMPYATSAAADAAGSVPMQPGTAEMTVSLQVTFSIS
jgi:uncharacterized protein